MARKNSVDEQAVVRLIINGEQAKNSLRDINLSILALERKLNNMKKADDPAGFEAMTRDLQKLKAAQSQMVSELRGSESSWARFKANWKEIALGTLGGNVGFAALGAIKQGFTKLITVSGELSDELADVQKKTGLAGAELDALNGEVQKLDTRTAREDLRKLATEAGSLGYTAREDVMDFVKAANMINVALGEDLGEGATKEIAKLTEIFKLKDLYGLEGSMLRVGSAINAVGMASTANEGYIVDFLKRMSGISGIANVSVQELIALGGTLDSLGQTSEVSSTALNKLLVKMGSDVPTYAKMAGVSVDEFRKVMKRSAVEGLMLVLKEVGKTTTGIEELASTLGDLGLDGGRVVGVLGTLAKNTGEYSRQLGISTDEFAKNTSVMNEYNIRNNNTAAILEKIGKRFSLLWEQASAAMNPLIRLFGKWLGVVDEVEEAVAGVQAQQQKVTDSEKNLGPLIDRYDKLAVNLKRSKEEQEEFAKITKQLADAVPSAVTQWDAYGNAMGINTWKVRDFATEQRRLLEVMRQQSIELAKNERARMQSEASQIQNELSKGTTRVNMGMGQYADLKLLDADIATRSKRLGELQRNIAKINNDIARLEGKVVDPPAETPPATGGTGGNDDTGGGGAGGSGGSDKKVSEAQKLADELLKNQQRLTMNLLTEHEKEIAAVQIKYEEFRKKAGNNKEQLTAIAEQEAQEMQQISDRMVQKNLDSFDKLMRTQLKGMNEEADKRKAFKQELLDDEAKLQDKELFEIKSFYYDKIKQAEMLGENTVGIYVNMYNAIRDLQIARANEEIQTEQEKNQKLLDDQKKKNEETLRNDLELIEKKRQVYQDITGAIGNVLSIMAQNEKDFTEFQKALAIVQIAIDTGAAIASGVAAAAAAAKDPFTLIAAIATTVATVTANILKAKQIVKGAEAPEPPAFRADGGYTDMAALSTEPGGWVSRPTLFAMGRRRYVAGERGREYVISNPMLQNPAVADFVTMMESLRQTNAFAYPQASNGGPGGPGPAADPRIDEMIRLLKTIASKPDAWNYNAFEKYRDLVDGVRNRANA